MTDAVINIIKDILSQEPCTRKDDFLLYARCVEELNRHNMTDYLKAFCYVLKNHKYYKLPNYATVIRHRRKIQADNPNLTDAKTVRERKMKEIEMHNMFR